MLAQSGEYSVSCDNLGVRFNKKFVSSKTNNGVFKFEFYSAKPEEVESYLVFNNDKIGQLTYLLKVKVD